MRQNKRSKNFQSHEARFEDYIICVSYNKSYLLPGEKMELSVSLYVIEYAEVDTRIQICLNSGGVQWEICVIAKGKPPSVSQDLLFLLQDLDDIDRLLKPLEIGRDVHLDAILAQPDKVAKVSLRHLLEPLMPDTRRHGISYLTCMPAPASRFVVDPRRKRWFTDRQPLSFDKSGLKTDVYEHKF